MKLHRELVLHQDTFFLLLLHCLQREYGPCARIAAYQRRRYIGPRREIRRDYARALLAERLGSSVIAALQQTLCVFFSLRP